MCIYPKCIFAKCTRLACLLSFASLFSMYSALRSPKELTKKLKVVPSIHKCLMFDKGAVATKQHLRKA